MQKFRVKRGLSGLGLFATADIPAETYLTEYVGEKVSDAEADRRGGKYLFKISDEWTIDGRSRENLARYFNHSCAPNCYAELDEDAERVYFYTEETVRSGDELTVDYGQQYFDIEIAPHGCRCRRCATQSESN